MNAPEASAVATAFAGIVSSNDVEQPMTAPETSAIAIPSNCGDDR